MSSCVRTRPCLVNDERCTGRHVAVVRRDGHVGPAVELTDDLLKRQPAGDDGFGHLVWRHAGHTDVSSAAPAVV